MDKKIKIKTSLIAPCGINCVLCYAYQREKNSCSGCLTKDSNKPYHCLVCSIKSCEFLKTGKQKYCYSCEKYSCRRIKDLDKRYRTKYKMSLIENLNSIKENGIRSFVKNESEKWICKKCGTILCVHKETCSFCGENWSN